MKKPVLLALIAFVTFNLQAQTQDCSELFFSEYVEGSHNNKVLEIYNPTIEAIDLGSYRVVRWSNGSNTSDTDVKYTQPLSGTILALSTFIVALDKQSTTATGADTALFPELLTICQTAEANGAGGFYSPVYGSGDVGSNTIYHNGDDAISLQKTNGSTWANVDIFGVIGEQPLPAVGSSTAGWTDVFPYSDGQGAYWTKDKTLIRKSSVKKGVSANPGLPYTGAFNPSVEYDSLPENTFLNLGMHDCECANVGINDHGSELAFEVYPNPSAIGTITVSAAKPFGRVSLVNVLGVEVFATVNVSTDNIALNTEKFDAGIYLLQLEFTEGTVATRKVVIR
ncbi:MAG: hypothetical protein RL266_1122 [Bacteroidota bacterium]|jgi:hypothetical protein